MILAIQCVLIFLPFAFCLLPTTYSLKFIYLAVLTNNHPPEPKPKKLGNQAAKKGERIFTKPNAPSTKLNK
jgi:hypothetical protein